MGLEDLIFPISASCVAAGVAIGLAWGIYARCYVTVPPNRALVLYGRRSSRVPAESGIPPTDVKVHRPRIVVGGGLFIAPWNKGVGRISLDAVSVDLSVRSMHVLDGTRASGWDIRLQIQVKIPTEPGSLSRAAENLLGKSDEEIQTLIRRTVEAGVPAVLSRLRTEDGGPDWDRLAAEIQASVAPDLVAWGFVVQTLSVTELHRILPVEGSTSLTIAKSIPHQGSAGDREITNALLGGLDSRLARAEYNLGIVAAVIARRNSGVLGPAEPSMRASVLDIPLGQEVPATVVATEEALASLHESMEGDRSPPTHRRPEDHLAAEGGRDHRAPLD